MQHAARSTLRSLGALALGSALIASIGSAQQTAPATPPTPVTSTIVGFIFDSTTMRPLVDATIQVVTKDDIAHGHSFTVGSDSSGYFRIPDVSAGSYVITFFHPRLEEVGLSAPLRGLEVRGARTDIELAIPSTRRVIALHCGARDAADSSGLLIGTVVRADAPDPVAGATVTARWFQLTFSTRGLVRSMPKVQVITDANGRFSICGLPGDATLMVWATLGRATTGEVGVDVQPRVVSTLELALDVGDTVPVAADSAPARRGSAQVSGLILSPAGGAMPGSRVGVRGTGNETVADATGAFTLSGLPSGSQTLEARAIGFVPVARNITLSATRPLRFDIRFDSAARILKTVEVRGRVIYDRATEEFDKLKKSGFGYFIDADMIEKRQPFRTSDLLRNAPGVRVTSGGGPGSSSSIQIRGAGNFQGVCQPGIVIDGMLLSSDAGDIDALAQPQDISGIAVYRGAAEVPVEYRSNGSCGLIQIWTRRGNTPRGRAK